MCHTWRSTCCLAFSPIFPLHSMLSLTVPLIFTCAVPPLVWAFACVSLTATAMCVPPLCPFLGPQPCVVNSCSSWVVIEHPPLQEDVPAHTCLGGPPMGPPRHLLIVPGTLHSCLSPLLDSSIWTVGLYILSLLVHLALSDGSCSSYSAISSAFTFVSGC